MKLMDASGVTQFIVLAKGVLDLYKQIKDSVPKGPQKEALEKSIAQAERALRVSEVKIAEELDYNLCRCTFPPQIMLQDKANVWTCEKCGRVERPSPLCSTR